MNLEEYQNLLEQNKTKENFKEKIPSLNNGVELLVRDYYTHNRTINHYGLVDRAFVAPDVYNDLRELAFTTDNPITVPVQVPGVRRSGRTTKMIFQALTALCENKDVIIVTPIHNIGYMIRLKLENLLEESGMHSFRHNVQYCTLNNIPRGLAMNGNRVIFYDHTCNEL